MELKLANCKKALISLRPLCSHCAQTYQLLTEASKGNHSVSWKSFLSWFKTWFAHQAEGMKENLELRDDVIQSFHKTVVQSCVRYLLSTFMLHSNITSSSSSSSSPPLPP